MASSMPSQAVARSGDQVRGSLPSSAKAEVDMDWEESERERDILAKLPLDQLLKEMRVPPPEIGLEPLNLLDASRRCMSPRCLKSSSVLVHVYNLNETFARANKVLAVAGSGAFHAGVEIFGWEWSYGVHGVRKSIPRNQTRHIYKCSVFLGDSDVSHVEFVELLSQCFQDFLGDNYELVGHNCCTFARALVRKLQVRSMPSWVDRLARGLNLGAKATRMAVHPMKQAAALGGRMLRMSRGEGSESEEDEDALEDQIPGAVMVPSPAAQEPQPAVRREMQPGIAQQPKQMAKVWQPTPGQENHLGQKVMPPMHHAAAQPFQAATRPDMQFYAKAPSGQCALQQQFVPPAVQAVHMPGGGYAMATSPAGQTAPGVYVTPGQMYPVTAHPAPRPGFR